MCLAYRAAVAASSAILTLAVPAVAPVAGAQTQEPRPLAVDPGLGGAIAAPALARDPLTGAVGAPAIVSYTITDGRAIVDSLTGRRGDPARGRALHDDAAQTGCRLCHDAHGLPGAAPDLDGVGNRLTPGELRLWLVAPTALDPDLRMHGYYDAGQRTDPRDPMYGGPRLTAAQIEDLVAWLATLKQD